jgi:hypothetical protein
LSYLAILCGDVASSLCLIAHRAGSCDVAAMGRSYSEAGIRPGSGGGVKSSGWGLVMVWTRRN